MPLSPDQAADTLRDIERAERRSFSAYGYQSAAPHLILWGVILACGYSASDLWQAQSGEIWLALIAIAFVASGVIGRRMGRGKHSFRANNIVGLRITANWVVLLAFFYALFAIMEPVSERQTGAFFPLFFGTIYMLVGTWMGLRLAITGAAVAGVSLIAFFYVHAHFGLWMAVIGGGGLILGGLWLRKA